MGHREHKEHALKEIAFGIVTVSDTRGEAEDASGQIIRSMVVEAGHHVRYYNIVKDDVAAIKDALGRALERCDAVVVNGGTGVATKDVTIDAVSGVLDKALPGFGELFRTLSYDEIGSAAMMSRAVAGTVGDKVVFCIPGSPGAVRLAMEKLILKEAGHVLWEARK